MKNVPISEIGMAVGGNDRGPPVAQEQENDHYHQTKRDEDRLFDFGDRIANEGRDVEAVAHFDVGRDIFLDLFDTFIEFVGNGDIV